MKLRKMCTQLDTPFLEGNAPICDVLLVHTCKRGRGRDVSTLTLRIANPLFGAAVETFNSSATGTRSVCRQALLEAAPLHPQRFLSKADTMQMHDPAPRSKTPSPSSKRKRKKCGLTEVCRLLHIDRRVCKLFCCL